MATGAQDKKLKIFDLSRGGAAASPDQANGSLAVTPSTTSEGHEIGAGEHGGSIKSIVWNVDYNILTTACEDKTLRWWDLRTQRPIATYKTDRDISSCELSTNKAEDSDPGILSVAVGQSCIFFDAGRPGEMIKQVKFDHEVASVAINPSTGRFVTGGCKDTWVRVWDFAQEKELGRLLNLHGDLYTDCRQRCSKVIMDPSGRPLSHPMGKSTQLVVRTGPSSCGRPPRNHMVFGAEGCWHNCGRHVQMTSRSAELSLSAFVASQVFVSVLI